MSGLIVAFEGIYASGKSTQARLLAEWCAALGLQHVLTEWNSSPALAETILELKRRLQLVPRALVLLEAADLADRYEHVIEPALASGAVVIADRWVHSGVVRGVVRGVDPGFARSCFSFVREPDLLVVSGCPAALTLERRMATGRPISGYVCGEDFHAVTDRPLAFVSYQQEVAEAYQALFVGDALRLCCRDAPEVSSKRVREALGAILGRGTESGDPLAGTGASSSS